MEAAGKLLRLGFVCCPLGVAHVRCCGSCVEGKIGVPVAHVVHVGLVPATVGEGSGYLQRTSAWLICFSYASFPCPLAIVSVADA